MGLLTAFDSVTSALETELRGDASTDLTWGRRLWLYRNGFLSCRDGVWDLTPETIDLYLSDVESRRTGAIDAPYDGVLRNKLLFHMVVARTHDRLLPDTYGVLRDGRVVDAGHGDSSFEEVLDRLREGPIVAKPVVGAKADGVQVLDRRGNRFSLNGRPIERTALRDALAEGRDRLLTEYVDQAAYAARIAPASTNTIRVLTMIDPETAEPFVARAVHRFGTPASSPVDNWGAGGLSARIDPETGSLSRAVASPHGDGAVGGWVDRHPESGVRFADTVVPKWDRIEATVLDLARVYGHLWPHVGWDVVVRDDTGSVAVLEGEPRSVDADLQAHGPLLADDRVREFYEHHGVLSSGRWFP